MELEGRPPWPWYWIAGASVAIVWAETMLSFTIEFLTPTVGLGCWSGCILLYGILIGITAWVNWSLQFFFRKDLVRGWRARAMESVAHCLNYLALGWLVVVTGIIVSLVLFAQSIIGPLLRRYATGKRCDAHLLVQLSAAVISSLGRIYGSRRVCLLKGALLGNRPLGRLCGCRSGYSLCRFHRCRLPVAQVSTSLDGGGKGGW